MRTSRNRGAIISRAALERLWLDPSLTRQDIGDRLGISGSAVGWRAKALGLPPRKGGVADRYDRDSALFARMWNANVRPAEMGRYFGVRLQAILWNARRRGLTRNCTRHNSISLGQFQEVELAFRIAAANTNERTKDARQRKSRGRA